MYTNTSSQLCDDCDVVSSMTMLVNNDSPRITSGGKSILQENKHIAINLPENSWKKVSKKNKPSNNLIGIQVEHQNFRWTCYFKIF